MTLPSSGAISFSQIRSEFGSVGNDGLSSYGALDSGIPASGATIKFSNFYNKILNATRTVSTIKLIIMLELIFKMQQLLEERKQQQLFIVQIKQSNII